MTVADVTNRISSIQGQIAMLTQPIGNAAAFASAMGTAARMAAPASTTATTATGSTTGLTSGGPTGEQVIAEASKYIGVPYVWGGTDPEKGLDCSGLVQLTFRNLGIELPRVSRDQALEGTPVASLDEAQPGDLLAFGSPVHHIAIYAGDGKMIEAPRPGLDVRLTDVWETPSSIRRVLGSGSDATTSALAPTSAMQAMSASLGAGAISAAGGTSTTGVPFADLFSQAASTYGLDPALLTAVARQESGFDPSAVSPAGAQGLMQLMPATAKGLGVGDSFDPAQSIDGAARMLADLTKRFGSTELALAAYNAGPGAVLRHNGIPPYAETQNYVRSIMSKMGQA